jgi:hypothetical protein
MFTVRYLSSFSWQYRELDDSDQIEGTHLTASHPACPTQCLQTLPLGGHDGHIQAGAALLNQYGAEFTSGRMSFGIWAFTTFVGRGEEASCDQPIPS